MSRISQTPIPNVRPDEPITPALFNQIIRGANNARQVTGSEGIDVTNIAGMLGLSLSGAPVSKNRSVMVYVDTTITYGPGMYAGRIFFQDAVLGNTKTASGGVPTVHEQPNPIPNQQTCVVINTLTFNRTTVPIPLSFVTNGLIEGIATNGMPLVTIQKPETDIWGKITAVSGTTPGPWNYTAQSTDAVTTFNIVHNLLEVAVNGTTSSAALVGTPGSLGVNIGSNGTVNGTACVVQSFGVGATVPLFRNPYVVNGPTLLGGAGGWVFSLPNSAQ